VLLYLAKVLVLVYLEGSLSCQISHWQSTGHFEKQNSCSASLIFPPRIMYDITGILLNFFFVGALCQVTAEEQGIQTKISPHGSTLSECLFW
jgi:hypothetical protein